MEYFYIKDPSGFYYRNATFSFLSEQPTWVENQSEATICTKQRTDELISNWGLETSTVLEPLPEPKPSKPSKKPKKIDTSKIKMSE